MTDVSRSLDAIKTLFADNTSGGISPQDLRDFVQSLATPVSGGFGIGPTVFNVKAAPYGAIGDGVADDTGAIQAAIDAAALSVTPNPSFPTTKIGGAIVFFPRGWYLISAQLDVPFNSPHPGDSLHTISLQGVGGQHGSYIQWKTGAAAPPKGMIYIHPSVTDTGGQVGGRYSGLALDGNGIASTGFHLEDVSDSVFSQLNFGTFAAGTNGACIYMAAGAVGCLLDTIENCFFYGGENFGVYQEQETNDSGNGFMNGTRIINNEFGFTKPGSVWLNGDNGARGTVLVEGNYFEGLHASQPTGKASISAGWNTRIIGNWFEDTTPGQTGNVSILMRADNRRSEIAGNLFGGSGWRTIQVEGGFADLDIHDNAFNDMPTSHIYFPGTGYGDIRVHHNKRLFFNYPLSPFLEFANAAERANVSNGFNPGFPMGYETLLTDGVSTKVTGSTPTDALFPFVEDGMLAIKTDGSFYGRIGGVWTGLTGADGPQGPAGGIEGTTTFFECGTGSSHSLTGTSCYHLWDTVYDGAQVDITGLGSVNGLSWDGLGGTHPDRITATENGVWEFSVDFELFKDATSSLYCELFVPNDLTGAASMPVPYLDTTTWPVNVTPTVSLSRIVRMSAGDFVRAHTRLQRAATQNVYGGFNSSGGVLYAAMKVVRLK